MIRRCFSNHSSDVIKPLYQAIVRIRLSGYQAIEYNSPVLNPWLLKDIQELDKVQKRCLKLCSTNIDLEPPSRRRDRADLCETWKQLKLLDRDIPTDIVMEPEVKSTYHIWRNHIEDQPIGHRVLCTCGLQ